MIYIIYSKRDEKLTDRIGVEEMQCYSNLKDFYPLLEKRGNVVLVEDPKEQVDGVHQFANYLKEPSFYISFSPPDQDYLNVNCPKLFISSILRNGKKYFSGQLQIDSKEILQKGIKQSLAGISHCLGTLETLSSLTKDQIPLDYIPSPIWDHYNKLHEENLRNDKTLYPILSNGDIIDSSIRSLTPTTTSHKTPMKRRIQSSRAALQKSMRRKALEYLLQRNSVHFSPTELTLSGVVFTAIVRPKDPFKNWKNLIKEFCHVFKKTTDAILIIKMVGRVEKNTKNSMFRILKWRFIKCRIIIINEHLPQEQYENLIRSTTYFINTSTAKEMGSSLLEFMSAGKPVIGLQHSEFGILSYQNTFIAPETKGKKLSIKAQLKVAYDTIKNDPIGYQNMAESATENMKNYCSRAIVEPKFFTLLDEIEALLN